MSDRWELGNIINTACCMMSPISQNFRSMPHCRASFTKMILRETCNLCPSLATPEYNRCICQMISLSAQEMARRDGSGERGSSAGEALVSGVLQPNELSRRICSTVTPKKSASCRKRLSSGVRLPFSQGDHCWGETPKAAAHCCPPPRPGNFFTRSARMFAAMIFRRSSGILPIDSPLRQLGRQ